MHNPASGVDDTRSDSTQPGRTVPQGGSDVNYSAARLQSEYEERRPIRDALTRIADRWSVSGRNVVELGSGLGFNLEIFAPRNKVIGIEGLESAANLARARGIPTMAADLSRALPLETASCDLVLCLDVLEHLMEPEFTLKEAHRILKPGGSLVVNVPNHFTLSGRLRILLGSGADSVRFFPESTDWNNPHVRFFRRASIGGLLEFCDFRIVEDWSSQFPSIPAFHRLGWNNSRLAVSLARRRPDLFAGGFFLISARNV
jgi:SAM-dependent methyltransferase